MQWQASWTQAMIDFGVMDMTFTDVTLRMRPTATIGGEKLRLEFDNRFGTEPITLGHVVVTAGGAVVEATFGGSTGTLLAVGEAAWTDALSISVAHGDAITVDVYLPEPTRYATGNVWGAPFHVSQEGDFAGSADFVGGADLVLPTPDGATVPLSAPLLRGVEVSGGSAVVVVCLGDSITVAGWPELAAALLPADPRVALVNRGIAGNRLRFDPVPQAAMFGRAGLTRFDDDVLATAGVTHVVLALGTNDLGHPGTMAPPDQLPTAAELIASYGDLIARATAAGVSVIIGTIPPFLGASGYDDARNDIRNDVNSWIRGSAPAFVDFDKALYSAADPSRLADEFDSGDHLHPNEEGQARMARAMADALPN